jgi:tetratricopeptide (TPR) repeat protein
MSTHDYYAFLRLADESHRQGNYETELHYLDEALALRPTEYLIYLRRGNYYQNRLDFPNAIREYTAGINLDPTDTTFYINRAVALSFSGDNSSAIEDMTICIEIEPQVNRHQFYRGHLYMGINDFLSAERDFDSVIASDTTDLYAHSYRGRARIQLGKFAEAVDDLTFVISHAQIRIEREIALRFRGIAYLKNGNYELSVADFTTLIQSVDDPLAANFYDEFYYRGCGYRALDQVANTISDYQKALKINPAHSKSAEMERYILEVKT